MKIEIFSNEDRLAIAAARHFSDIIARKPDCVLGFATGSTPLPLYRELIRLYEAGEVDFSAVHTFNLDEYAGISRTQEQSYYKFMFDNLFSKINIKKENICLPNPEAEDPEAECKAYDLAIEAAGGIDLQLLGIGHNGHIGFNEPSDAFPEGTHIVELTKSTIEANKRFFDSEDDVPKKAITMGIGTIMKAREIVMIATGAGKAEAVNAMINGKIDPRSPASILQKHTAVTVFLDEEAASLLE